MKRFAILAAFLIAFIATPVLAISNPSSVSITNIHATSNVLQTGDILFMAEYNLAYTVIPTDFQVNEAFIFRLIDTDGTTELGRVLAYPYVNNGYGKGVISFYFSNTTAPSANVNYIIRVTGNPAVLPGFIAQNFTMPSSTYTAYSSNADSDIYTQVIRYATDINPVYETILGTALTSFISGTNTITLSSGVGDVYFMNAIPNLQNMAPSLFFVQAGSPVATTQSFNTTQADAYKNRFVANWVGDSQNALATLFNTDMQVAMGLVVFALCVLWGFVSYQLSGNVNGIYLLAGNTLLGSTVLGWISMAFMSVIVFLCAVYIGFILIYRGVQA